MVEGIHEERAFFKQYKIDIDSLDAAVDASDDISDEDKAEMFDAIDIMRYDACDDQKTFTGEVRAILRKLEDFDPEQLTIEKKHNSSTRYHLDLFLDVLNWAGPKAAAFSLVIKEIDGELKGQLGNSFESELEWGMDSIAEDPMEWVYLAVANAAGTL